MMKRKGFTLIELLIVVVIIGILAAIAIPKFALTKDKAKLASVKTDIRNFMTAEEAYFSDNNAYGTVGQLQAPPYGFLFSGIGAAANTGAGGPAGAGWQITVTNPTISTGATSCSVTVGGGGPTDGQITCP
jgi:prepilin-type N-terminal cleavage/methylation domain-containing protein